MAKQQAAFLRQTKIDLGENEFIVSLDFSENYSFVVQDATQGWHWSKSRCTIHPFVMYYNNKKNNVLEHLSYVIHNC